jgi:Domain of unknown function (DUF4412)
MNNKIFKLALGLSFTLTAFAANAQKNYTEGVIIYTMSSPAGSTESKVLFRGDSTANINQYGPALVTIITTTKRNYFVALADVPIASIKKAAVLTPDEIDQESEKIPKLTFTPTTDAKQINGYNCKKFTAKDAKSATDIEVWVTNDISAPSNIVTGAFATAGGFPVQVTTTTQGQKTDITLKSITDQKIPAGSFSIPKDFDRITYDEMMAMRQR